MSVRARAYHVAFHFFYDTQQNSGRLSSFLSEQCLNHVIHFFFEKR